MMRWGVAVDVGNFAIKARFFRSLPERGVPWGEPARFPLQMSDWRETLASWYQQQCTAAKIPDEMTVEWRVASVNPPPAQRLREWVEGSRERSQALPAGESRVAAAQRTARWQEFRCHDIPLRLDVRNPTAVGIDRLVAAWAAWQGRSAGRLPSGTSDWQPAERSETSRPVIVVDAGSAVTVDLVDAGGTFRGGAILPGRSLQLRSLGLGAFALPDLAVGPPEAVGDPSLLEELECPGRDTAAAIELGVLAGIVGAVRELQIAFSQGVKQPLELVLSGGDASRLLPRLGPSAHWVPTLLLDGLASL